MFITHMSRFTKAVSVSGLCICLVLLTVLAPIQAFAGSEETQIRSMKPNYETTIKKGPYTGFTKAYQIFVQSGFASMEDSNGVVHPCHFSFHIYYSPERDGIEYDIEPLPESARPKVGTDCTVLKREKSAMIDFVHYTFMQPGETLGVESQTDAISETSTTIYSLKNGNWEPVASNIIETTYFNENSSAIADYVIQANDTKLKVVSRFVTDKTDGAKAESEMYFVVYVGSGDLGIMSNLLKIIIPILFVIIVLISFFVRKIKARKYIYSK